MKKIYSFLSFLLFATLSFAQTDFTIGTGLSSNTEATTSATTTGYPCPLQDYYEGSRSQYLYLASELQAAGMASGFISSVKFNVTALNTFSGTIPQYTISVGTSTATDLSATAWETGTTAVYGPVDYVPVVGLNEFTFSSPFFWDGTSNIIIEICNGDPNNANVLDYTQNVSCAWTTSLSFNASHTYRADNLGNLCGTSTTTNYGSQTSRPDVVLSWFAATACSGTPAAGTTTSTKDSVCPFIPFTVGVTGGFLGTGLTYQWEVSTNNGGSWSNIAGAIGYNYAVTAGINTNSCYRRKTTCTASGITVTSTSKCIVVKPFYECYCSPNTNNTLYTTSTTATIESIGINGPSVSYSNSHSGSNAAPSLGYAAFTDTSVGIMPILTQATTYTLTTTTSSNPTGAGYWIDWNHNNVFDSAEYTAIPFAAAATSADAIIDVPTTAPIGLTMLRIRTRNATFNYSNACTSFGNGETEDYIFRVAAAPNCSGTPTGGTTASTKDSVCPNNPYTLSVSGDAQGVLGLTYQWEKSDNCGATFTAISGATGKTYTVATQSINTSYRRKITCGANSSYSTPVCVYMKNITQCYCSPRNGVTIQSGTSPFINNITITDGAAYSWDKTAVGIVDVNNSTGTEMGYAMYDDTMMMPHLQQAVNYTLTTNLSATGAAKARIYIDYDHSGTFEETEAKDMTISGTTATVDIMPTATAPLGITLMRIRNRVINFTTACENNGSGETEDFVIKIEAGNMCSGAPAAGTITAADNAVCTGKSFSLKVDGATANVIGLTYQWYSASTSGGTYTAIAGATHDTLNISGITTNTCYKRGIKCNGGAEVLTPEQCITIKPFYECYCNPLIGNNLYTASSTPEINFFAIVGGNPAINYSNVHTPSNPVPSLGYELVKDTTAGVVPVLKQANTYTVSVGCNVTPGSAGVWVDWNHNNVFDSSEYQNVVYTAGNSSADIMLDVPINATLGLTVLRARISSTTGMTYNNSCTQYANGETEDYVFRVAAGTPCSGTPTGGSTVSAVDSTCPNNPFQLSVTGSSDGFIGLTYQWEKSDNCGATFTAISGATSKTYLVPTQNIDVSYRRKITCGGNSSYSTPVCVYTKPFLNCYCAPPTTTLQSGTSPWIDTVFLNGGTLAWDNIAYPNVNNSTNGYTRYDDTTVMPQISQGIPYTLKLKTSGTPTQATAWIDWDHSGTFDASERTDLTVSALTSTVTITPSNTAPIGVTMMRIRIRGANFTTACETNLTGETEDYVLRVNASSMCSGTPVGGTTVSTSTSVCKGLPFILSVTGSSASATVIGNSYQWQDSTAGNWSNITGATALTYTTSLTTGNRYFRRKIKCSASNDSSYSSVLLIALNTPTYATLPFAESFEGTWIDGCGTSGARSIPTNSWRNTPFTGDTSWRRNDDGASANWTNPANGAYLPTGSNGTKSARFHVSSIPNSAPGNLDLYLDCSGGASIKRLTFDAVNQTGTDSLSIMLSTDGGTSFTRIDSVGIRSVWSSKSIDFTSTSATTVIRFKGVGDVGTSDIGLDNVNVASLLPIDVQAVAIVTPTGSTNSTTTGKVVLTIKNNGGSILDFATTPCTITAKVTNPSNNLPLYTHTLSTGTLAIGASKNDTITTTANFTEIGSYTVRAWAKITGDGNVLNDTTALSAFAVNNGPVVAVASGFWGDGATWNTGVVPVATDTVNISGFTVTLNGGAQPSPYYCSSLGIGANGNLIVNGAVLNIGPGVGGNKALTVASSGGLNFTGGTLNHNGYLLFNTGANFAMASGNLNIDGNDGTDVGSVPTGVDLLGFGTSTTVYSAGTINVTGGTISFVDPHRTGGAAFAYRGSVVNNLGTGNTIIMGNTSSSHTASTGSNGFQISLNTGGARMALGNLMVAGGSAVGNRFTSSVAQVGIQGNLVIAGFSEYRSSQQLYVAGNITNDGILANNTIVNLQTYLAGVAGSVSNPQSISGTGIYRNTIPALTITNGGAGYSVGDIVTLTGGTFVTPLTAYVSAVNAGVISSVVVLSEGNYTVAPTGAVAVSGGTGTGATLTAANVLSTAQFAGLVFNNNNTATGITISSLGTLLSAQTGTVGGSASSALRLLSGVVNNTPTITLGNSIAQRGVLSYTSGVITGKFARWFAAATNATTTGDFPVGKGTIARNARVEFTTAPTKGGVLTAEFVTTDPGTAGLPLNDGIVLSNIAHEGFWRIDNDTITGGNYTVSITDSGINNAQNVATLRLIKRPSNTATWTLDGIAGTNSGTLTKPTVVRTGCAGFSEFAIAGASDNPLPSTSITIKGNKISNANNLTWTVENEKAVAGYELQRSTSATSNFETITYVVAKNANANTMNYNYSDGASIYNDAYYRVKQISKDGSISYSNIIMIKGLKVSSITVGNIYPNPTKDILNVAIASPKNNTAFIVVTDVLGKQIMKQPCTVVNGDNVFKLNVSQLAAAKYILTIVDNNGNVSNNISFIKQ